MVFNYWGGRLVLRKPVNLGKNSYFSSQATIWSEVVHSLIQREQGGLKGRPFRECVFSSGPAIVSVIVSVFGVPLWHL